MSDETTQQAPHSFLQLTEHGAEALISVLEVARRHGDRTEAAQALQFMAIVDQNAELIKKQIEEAETKAEEVETKTEDLEGAV